MWRIGSIYILMFFCGSLISSCGGCDREVYVRQSGAMITVNPTTLDFGQVPQGLQVTKIIEILNPGQKALIIESTQLSDENDVFMITVPDEQVNQSSTMEITVTFSPTEIKAYEAVLTLSSDAENEKLSLVALMGAGIPDSLCGDCSTPPENRCLSEYELLIYDNLGACVDDQCQYQASQIYCEFGCDEEHAICLDDSGNVPPSPSLDAGVQTQEPETIDSGNELEPEPEVDAGPILPYEGPEVAEVRVGFDGWTCVRMLDGVVQCWGKNKWGQLGQGWWDGSDDESINPQPTATVLPESAIATHLVTGLNSTAVMTDDGNIYCWGSCPHRRPSNTSGQNIHTPEMVSMSPAGMDMDVGWGHACVVSAAGQLTCWGSNWFGGLATGDDVYPTEQPVTIIELDDVTQVALGNYHTCALQDNNQLYCWGWNRYHQVGLPASEDEVCPDTAQDSNPTLCVLAPRLIEGFGSGEILDIGAGGSHTCIIVDTGKVFCWGNNQSGAVGDGVAQGFVWYGEPTETIDLGQPAVKLGLGSSHTLVILEDGSIKGWGGNSNGQLGDGSNVRRPSPVAVTGLPLPVEQLSVGSTHTCAVLEDRSVWCWGKNNLGQLGDGSTVDSWVPVRVVFASE